MASLPPLAPFPRASWRQHLSSSEWDALLETWLTICQAYLALSDTDLSKKADENDSLPTFLLTFTEETAESGPSVLGSRSIALLKFTFQLISRLFSASPPTSLLSFGFLSGVSKIYPKKRTAALLAQVFETQGAAVEASLSAIKKRLIPQLDAGIKGDLRDVESKLLQLNPLLHVSSHACTLFLAGSDFFDGLITCFRVMNPPLRKAIITTIYLCLVGLTEAQPPKWAMLNDQLYSLKAAADTHKAGPLNANDSLVAELVTSTPILRILSRRAEEGNAASDNFKSRVTALQGYKKGPMVRPKKLIKRKVDKGKGKMSQQDADADMHIHKMSLVTQVQDLFPDLGAGFIMKCLDEYGDDVEQVVANLLSDSLPPHLSDVDRSEPLTTNPTSQSKTDLAPHSTPPLVPTRRNIYDDDDFDRLSMDVSKLSFGKRPGKTADQMLADKSAAPGKAAILSALAAFDSDDDERDDTYDAADVGGTVDGSNQEADGVSDGNEQVLYRAYQMDEKVFDRDATTRRGPARARLRDETGMTDETIEGWAVMLARNPQQKRRLEAKYAFSGEQAQIERTSWRASAGSGAEESDPDGGASRGGRGGGRGRGRGRGRGGQGRGGGNVAGPTGDKDTEAARRRKEANKGSRANHNRREGRARKMARGFGS